MSKVSLSRNTVAAILLPCGIFMILLGLYLGFVRHRDYVSASAVITEVRELAETDARGDPVKRAVVRFSVNGTEYGGLLDDWDPAYAPGREARIQYDPKDPSRFESASRGFAIYLLTGGAAVLAIGLFSLVRSRAQRKERQKMGPPADLPASRPGERTRTLHFISGIGSGKGGCRLEDEEGRPVYEAVMTKRSLTADCTFEFIDSASGRSGTHLVSRTETRKVSYGGGFSEAFGGTEFVMRSTFSYDGTDVWDHLHGQGVRIRTEIDGRRITYRITRNGAEIGTAETVRLRDRKEDLRKTEEEKADPDARKRGTPAFLVRTREEAPDALFLALFAIQRTDAVIYE